MWCLGAVVTVGMAMFLFQQFAGINAVVYFSTQVFRSAGITSDVAASALVGAANVIGRKSRFLILSLLICLHGQLYCLRGLLRHLEVPGSLAKVNCGLLGC